MESIIALIAKKTGEEQPTTALTKGQREECFTDELMRGIVRRKPHVQNFNFNFITIQYNIRNISVPKHWNCIRIPNLRDFAHIECQVSATKCFRKSIF